jgi:hypothetical protein
MTAQGKARLQSWVALVVGVVISAITATATSAFWFGGALEKLDRHSIEIAANTGRISHLREELQRVPLTMAQTYETKGDGQQRENRLDARLTRIEDKLDIALGLTTNPRAPRL